MVLYSTHTLSNVSVQVPQKTRLAEEIGLSNTGWGEVQKDTLTNSTEERWV